MNYFEGFHPFYNYNLREKMFVKVSSQHDAPFGERTQCSPSLRIAAVAASVREVLCFSA